MADAKVGADQAAAQDQAAAGGDPANAGADQAAAQDQAAAGGDPANAGADGAGGAGGAGGEEAEGGGASQAVGDGATVAGSVADTTGSVAGAAGLNGVAGGAGIASGAAGTTGGAAQIAGGDVGGGASGIVTGAGGATTSGIGVAQAKNSGGGSVEGAATGATSNLTGGAASQASSATGAPSGTTSAAQSAATNPSDAKTSIKGAPGATKDAAKGTVSDVKGDAKDTATAVKGAPGATKDAAQSTVTDTKSDAKGAAQSVKDAPGATKDAASGEVTDAKGTVGVTDGKGAAGGNVTAAQGGGGAPATAPAGTKAPATETKAPATDTKAPATDTKAPATDTKAPATDTKAPATDGKAPATDTKAPATDGKAPATDTKAPATDGKAPATDTKAPATDGKAPATDTKAPATDGKAPATDDGKAPATDTKAPATDGKAPATDGAAPPADSKAPAAADGKAPATDGKAPATDAAPADGKGAAGGTAPDAKGGDGAKAPDQAAPEAGKPPAADAGQHAGGTSPAQAGGTSPAQAGGTSPAQAGPAQAGETRPPIQASQEANQAVESSPSASQDGGGDGKTPDRGLPTPMGLGNIKDLAKLLKDGVDQAKPVIADLKDGKIDLSSINKIIDFAKSHDKNVNVAALKATLEKIGGIAPKALEEGKAFAQDIVKGGVTPETAQKIMDAVKTVIPGIEKTDFMKQVSSITDFATKHSDEIKKLQADIDQKGLAPAAEKAILDYAQKAIPGLVPEKFQAAFKQVVDFYKGNGKNIDAAIGKLKSLFGKSPEQVKEEAKKGLGGVLDKVVGGLFKGDKKFLEDIALKLSEASGGKVDPNALKAKLEQSLDDIVKAGRDPKEMLKLLATKMGGFVRGLEDLLKQFGLDPKKILDDVMKALEEFAKKAKEVIEPPKPPKPVRPPVDLFAASAAERYDYWKEVVTDVAKGKWEDAEKQLNVVGIRNFREWREVKEEDFHWNDSIVVLWKEGGKKRAEGFLASVDPARNHSEKPVHPAGAAHLVDGHYKYKKIELGLGAQKKMYAMPEGEIKFWRDRNRDAERDEEEHIEKGRTQIWIMPGGVQLTGDDFSSGAQVVAGGEKGPWKRFLELLKADAEGSFAYTLVDSAKLPQYRSKTLYLPLAAGAKKVPLKPFDPQLGARFNGIYKHVELGDQGGYYPMSLARSWHGGVHALAPQGQDTVVSVAAGEVVAARLGPIDAAKHKNGSANFVLLRHKYEKPDAKEGEKPAHWFSLYYHMQPVTDASLPWVWKIEQEAKKEEEKAKADEKKKQDAGQDAGQGAAQGADQAGGGKPPAKEVDIAEEKDVKHEKKGKAPAAKLEIKDGAPKEVAVPTTPAPAQPPPPLTEKKLLAFKETAVPKPAPNVRLAPSKVEWDVETTALLKAQIFLKKIEPERKFEASLFGLFAQYIDINTKQVVQLQGPIPTYSAQAPTDPVTGAASIGLGGAWGRYNLDYYVNGSKLPYTVGSVEEFGQNAKLTDAAQAAGWRTEGTSTKNGAVKFIPPQAVLDQPFPPHQLADVKASFDILVDDAKTFSFGAVGLNHVETVDLGPVAKGNKKIAIQLVPGSGNVGKFGFEAQVEISKAAQGGAGQAGQDAGQQQKPVEQKPTRLEWDVETEGVLKGDFTLTTLEHPARTPIHNYKMTGNYAASLDPNDQFLLKLGMRPSGQLGWTLKEGLPGTVPLQLISFRGGFTYVAGEEDARALTTQGGVIMGHLGFIYTEQKPGTETLRMHGVFGAPESVHLLHCDPPARLQGVFQKKILGYYYAHEPKPAVTKIKIFVDGKEKKVEMPAIPAGTALSKAIGQAVDLGDGKPGTKKIGLELDAPPPLAKWGASAKFEVQPKAPEPPRKDLAYEGDFNTSKTLKVKVTSNDPDKAVKVVVMVDDMTKKEILVEKKGETAEADLGDLPGKHKLSLIPQAVEGSLGESWKADLQIVTTRKASAEEAELMDNEFAFLVTRGQPGKFEKEFDSKGKVKIKVEFETAGGVKVDYGIGAQRFAGSSPKAGDKVDKDLGRVAAGKAKLLIEGKAADDFGKEPPKDWKPVIKAGAKFKVMLNAVDVKPNNPAEWGTIKPGSGYVLKYNKATGFEAFGFNLGTNALGTWTYAGADPDKGEITIWGHKFKFDAQGNVTDPKLTKLGVVGKLELLEVSVKGKVTITTEEVAGAKPPEEDKKDDKKGPATKSKESLDKAKEGKVGIFEPGAVKVAGGARLGVGSVYGSPGKRKKMIHFEVFSPGAEKPVFDPKTDKMGWEYVEDTDANGTVDVEKLLKAIDLDKDGTITATEVKAAYGGKGVGPKLRAYVVKHTSEWFTDWKSVLPSSEFWKKMLKDDELKEAANLAQELTFWDGGLSKWDMKDKLVINYHPFRFLQWMLGEQKAAAEASPYHFPPGAAWKLSKNEYDQQFNGGKGGDGKGEGLNQGPAQGGDGDAPAGGDGDDGKGGDQNPAQGGGANPAQGGGANPAQGGDGKGGAGGDTAPAGGKGDTAPAGGDAGGKGDTAPAGGDAGGKGDTAPAGGDAGGGKGDTAPAGGDTAPAGGDAGTGKGDTAPAGGDAGTGKGDTAPAGGDTAPASTGKGDAAPAGGDTAPAGTGKGDTAPAGTGKGDAAPAGGDTAPAGTGKGDTAPAGTGKGDTGSTGTTDGKGGSGGTATDSQGGSGEPAPAGAGKGDAAPAPAPAGTGKGDAAPAPAPAGTGKGDAAPAPAPAGTGKGDAAPAPAPAGTGKGDTAPAPAPASTGKGDTAPAPAPAGTGKGDTAPAPAPAGTGKGDTAPAPAPAGTGKGDTAPAPAPAGTGKGDAAPAPAPAGTGKGETAPAPAPTSTGKGGAGGTATDSKGGGGAPATTTDAKSGTAPATGTPATTDAKGGTPATTTAGTDGKGTAPSTPATTDGKGGAPTTTTGTDGKGTTPSTPATTDGKGTAPTTTTPAPTGTTTAPTTTATETVSTEASGGGGGGEEKAGPDTAGIIGASTTGAGSVIGAVGTVAGGGDAPPPADDGKGGAGGETDGAKGGEGAEGLGTDESADASSEEGEAEEGEAKEDEGLSTDEAVSDPADDPNAASQEESAS